MLRGRMILRRLLWVFPVAFGVVTLTFFMARVFNGDPTELYAPPEATDALRAQIRAQLGLADPLPVQYFHYLAELLRFNLGTSFTTGQSVASAADNPPHGGGGRTGGDRVGAAGTSITQLAMHGGPPRLAEQHGALRTVARRNWSRVTYGARWIVGPD